MASGHMNRVKRPDTWLHRPMLQNVKKVLANPEPSTHDPKATSAACATKFGRTHKSLSGSRCYGRADWTIAGVLLLRSLLRSSSTDRAIGVFRGVI
jgi:hypothetical protein